VIGYIFCVGLIFLIDSGKIGGDSKIAGITRNQYLDGLAISINFIRIERTDVFNLRRGIVQLNRNDINRRCICRRINGCDVYCF